MPRRPKTDHYTDSHFSWVKKINKTKPNLKRNILLWKQLFREQSTVLPNRKTKKTTTNLSAETSENNACLKQRWVVSMVVNIYLTRLLQLLCVLSTNNRQDVNTFFNASTVSVLVTNSTLSHHAYVFFYISRVTPPFIIACPWALATSHPTRHTASAPLAPLCIPCTQPRVD